MKGLFMRNRQEYNKAYRQAHKEHKKAYLKAYYEAHKEQHKARTKAYYQAHKDEIKSKKKAWKEANIEHYRAYQKAYKQANKEQLKAYMQSDVNSLGQTKASIRNKSRRILKQMNLHIDGYEIHHCFTYDDASKFIYISKALHVKIHKFLRDNNIDADTDHWMAIRDIVNSTDEFVYIKC